MVVHLWSKIFKNSPMPPKLEVKLDVKLSFKLLDFTSNFGFLWVPQEKKISQLIFTLIAVGGGGHTLVCNWAKILKCGFHTMLE